MNFTSKPNDPNGLQKELQNKIIPQRDNDNTQMDVANIRRKKKNYQSMIEVNSQPKDFYIKNTIINKNLIDISPFTPQSKDAILNYHFNRNPIYQNTQQQNSIQTQSQNQNISAQKRNSLPIYGISNQSTVIKATQQQQDLYMRKPIKHLSQMQIKMPSEYSQINESLNGGFRQQGRDIDIDQVKNKSQNNIQPIMNNNTNRSQAKKNSIQLPSIVSPNQIKDIQNLINSTSKRSKTQDQIESAQNISPFIPSIPTLSLNNKQPSISYHGSRKDEGITDQMLGSSLSTDLFNLALSSNKNINMPSSIMQKTGSSAQLNGRNSLLKLQQQSNTPKASMAIHGEINSNIEANFNTFQILNSQSSIFNDQRKSIVLIDQNNPSQRENFLNQLRETLMQEIKQSSQLDEFSIEFQSTKEQKEGQNQEVKVLGYQQRKESLNEMYISSRGNDRVYCFAEYLCKFSGYIIDLVYGDIPKMTSRGQKFDIQLSETVQELVLPIILDKLKDLGMKDIILRFEIVFKAEYRNLIMKEKIYNESDKQLTVDNITYDLLERLKSKYSHDFSQYSSTCKDFFTEILSESGDKQKIKDYMQFIRMHLKRASIFDSNDSPLKKQNAERKSPTKTKKTNLTSEQHKGIIESGNYQFLLNITNQDIFFMKVTIYDVIKKQLPYLSITNRAKILEKIELLRFTYFKEVYGIDDLIYNQLIEKMKTHVLNTPTLLAYLKRPDSQKHILKFITFLFDSILGQSTLQSFVDKSSQFINQEQDLPLLSMLEQGIKSCLTQFQINIVLSKEIEYKFVHLKRRARLIPPFNAIFQQIDELMKNMNSWIDLMDQQKQIKAENSEELIEQLKQFDFLEYFLVCSLSDFDTFSLNDITVGLNFYKIQPQIFKFWLKGIKRIFAKLKLKQKEINLIDDFLQKVYSNAQ